MKNKTLSVGLIEDNQLLRKSMEEFVEQDHDLLLLFSCNSIEKWLIHYDRDQQAPFILFLDIGLPGISGLKAISVLREKYPETKLVVISGDDSNESVWEAITSGAHGYLLKPFSIKDLRHQIGIIKGGGAALSPLVAEKLINRVGSSHGLSKHKKSIALTKRENEVLEQLVKGLSYKEVSQILKISSATVNDHVKSIYTKMGVNSKSELIVKVLKNRM